MDYDDSLRKRAGKPERWRTVTETILVVEDQDLVLNLIDGVLRSAGYKVLACDSAESALQTVESYPDQIDLLLTDIVLPGMNGIALAERFRAARSQAKVVFMSGYACSEIARGKKKDPPEEFIEKPFDHKTLCQRLRAVLDR
jgi:two-component system cell cycle sensor histidine kinase/response regulator CckA